MKNKTLLFTTTVIFVLIATCALAIYQLAPSVPKVGTNSVAATLGDVKTESRAVSGFSAVNFATVGELAITEGDAEALTIRAEERILRQLRTDVKDGVLFINAIQDSPDSLDTAQGIYYTLTVKSLDALTLSGAGSIKAMNIHADQLSVTLTGGGKLDIAGEANHQTVVLRGGGVYAAGNLKTRTARIDVTGVGSATVWVTDALDATIASVGTIHYFGSPQIQRQIKSLGVLTSLGTK